MRLFHFIVALALAAAPASALAKVRVVASITDLASIASEVGGEHVEVSAIAKGTADPHRVEILPSYMVRVAKADVYLKVGLGLDAWADGIIDGSRNGKLAIVDCSAGVRVLEKPQGAVDASMGDVHPNGNPHYWLDPRNAAVVAAEIADALAREDAAHAESFHAKARSFGERAQAIVADHARLSADHRHPTIVTYHRSWSYFADAFGFDVVTTIEPIPGIPPTAGHLQEVLEAIRDRKVIAILQEPYFSDEASGFLRRETGVNVIRESPSCLGPEAGSYLAHIEKLLSALHEAGAQ